MKLKLFLLSFIFVASCSAQECLIRCEPNLKDGGGACGTGFFIAPNRILTANHVVENEQSVRIEFDNKFFSAKVIRLNKAADLALLEANCESKYYEICEDEAEINDEVFCRGFPKAVWTIHKSDGIIKGINKVRLANSSTQSEQYTAWMNVIHGMSGGPLLNKDKKVIGVLSSKSVKGPMRAFFSSLKEIRKFLSEDSQ